jgi:heat shock protein HslJ
MTELIVANQPAPAKPSPRWRRWLVPVVVVAAVAAGAGVAWAVRSGRSPDHASASGLTTGRWQLVAITDAGRSIPVPVADAAAFIEFGIDATVSGSDGCNHFGGQVKVGGQSLQMRNVAITEIGCPATHASQIDAPLAGGSTRWAVSSTRLTLTSGAVVLTYEKSITVGKPVAAMATGISLELESLTSRARRIEVVDSATGRPAHGSVLIVRDGAGNQVGRPY